MKNRRAKVFYSHINFGANNFRHSFQFRTEDNSGENICYPLNSVYLKIEVSL